MIDPEQLIKQYAYTIRLLDKQLAGVTLEQSFVLMGGYNINWLTGHIISARQGVLERVGLPHIWTPEERSYYRNGSQPAEKEGPGVQRLDTLLETLHRSQTLIAEKLRQMTPEQFAAKTEFPQDLSVQDRLLYLQFHESFHAGQIVLIAQTLGLPGAWLT